MYFIWIWTLLHLCFTIGFNYERKEQYFLHQRLKFEHQQTMGNHCLTLVYQLFDVQANFGRFFCTEKSIFLSHPTFNPSSTTTVALSKHQDCRGFSSTQKNLGRLWGFITAFLSSFQHLQLLLSICDSPLCLNGVFLGLQPCSAPVSQGLAHGKEPPLGASPLTLLFCLSLWLRRRLVGEKLIEGSKWLRGWGSSVFWYIKPAHKLPLNVHLISPYPSLCKIYPLL